MALEIFKLFGSILVDNTKANDSIAKTDKKAQNVGSTLAGGIKTAAKWGAGIVAGATAAGTAIYGMAKKAAANTDEIDKMSQRLGMSRKTYQEWDYVLSQSGVDINSVQTGMKTLSNKIGQATNGTAKSQELFKKLGISMKEVSSLSREDMFKKVVTSLQGMQDSTERASIANQLFGKSGQNMTALFNQSAEGTQKLINKANELGMVLSDDVIDSGVSLTDTIDTLKRSFEGVATKLGASVIPIVEKVANFIIKQMPTIQSIFKKLEPLFISLGENLIPPLLDLASQILPPIVDLVVALLPTITDIASSVIPIIVDLLKMLMPFLVELIQALLPVITPLLGPIMDLLTVALELLKPILEVIKFLIPVIQLVVELISNRVRLVIEIITNKINTIKNVLNNIISFVKNVFTGNWKGAWESVKKIFTDIWEGIKTGFKIPINFIIRGLNAFIKGINKIKMPTWVPGVGGKGFNIKLIPELAKGGILEKGQIGFLEGNGAEAVVPLENNKKWISRVADEFGKTSSDKETKQLLAAILNIMEEIKQMGIYLDGKKLVGGIANNMNNVLGQKYTAKIKSF